MKDLLKTALDFAAKGTATWRIGVTFVLLFFITWSFGLMPNIFGSGFALAQEARKEHDEIKAAEISEHREIRSEIKGVKDAVESLAGTLADSEAKRAEEKKQDTLRLIRRQIFETERDSCNATGALRSELRRQANELRATFMSLTGTEYPPFDCAAIK